MTCTVEQTTAAYQRDVLKNALIGFNLRWQTVQAVAVTLYLKGMERPIDNGNICTGRVASELFYDEVVRFIVIGLLKIGQQDLTDIGVAGDRLALDWFRSFRHVRIVTRCDCARLFRRYGVIT